MQNSMPRLLEAGLVGKGRGYRLALLWYIGLLGWGPFTHHMDVVGSPLRSGSHL